MGNQPNVKTEQQVQPARVKRRGFIDAPQRGWLTWALCQSVPYQSMKKTIRILGILFGIFSLVSFTQRLFDIGVIAIAREMIEYYRTIAYFFLGMPARIFGFHFPSALMDMWTLSFIGATAYAKTPNIDGFAKSRKLKIWGL